MSDIFREIEEEVRREKLLAFWKAYGDYVLAVLALIVLAIGGYELWRHYDTGQRAKASAAFVAAQALTNPADAATAFAKIAKAAPSGYAALAKLSQANADVMSGHASDAVALYKAVANDNDGSIGAVARLRAAWLLADNTSRADLAVLLGPLTRPDSAWHDLAQEVLAYSDYKAGHVKAAAAAFEGLATDPQAPAALRSRARAFAVFLRGGGAKDFGTVPAPPPPAKTPAATNPPAPAQTPAQP